MLCGGRPRGVTAVPFLLADTEVDNMNGSAVLYPDIVRRNMALVSFLGFAGACLWFLPRSPFSVVFSVSALVLGTAHFAAWLAFPRFRDVPFFFISLAWFNVALLAFFVCDTGGLSSPFVFLFFWIMISQAISGVEDRWLPFFTAACYLFSVYGDVMALVEHPHTVAPGVYDPVFVAVVSGLNCVYIILAGLSSRHIINAVLEKLERSSLKQDELGRKFAEMSPYSQIGSAMHRIAHDLRTPLASALGYMDFKAAKASDKDDAELLKMISESLEEMSSMLTQITCYGRRSDKRREKVALKALLTGVRAMLSFHPAAAGVELTAHFPDGELHVAIPRHELQLALFNVIKNSLDAVGPRAEKKVKVVLRRSGSHAEVEVSDTGPGIPPGVLPGLPGGGAARKADGAGIGLEITSDFIRENGGEFEIGTDPRGGALVRIKLPLYSPA